ncbi:hypothetical protein [Clostridium kluyveri]|uniref:hypothetical protein n=1 Tax=Clostridium kluyveri TaxID=1534 RepID=UPI0022463F85|nr:hypothetical protein [Clostridium kluyveri]UZQ49087.1 hypothetical protein OP486_14105 [Clostridium kluyveri]
MKIVAEFNSNEELISFINTFSTKEIIPKAKISEIKEEEITGKYITLTDLAPENSPEGEESETEDKPEANIDKTPNAIEKITKEMVRAVFTKLIKSGKQKEAKDLTKKYGANRLPDIKEEDFEAIYKEAEGLI